MAPAVLAACAYRDAVVTMCLYVRRVQHNKRVIEKYVKPETSLLRLFASRSNYVQGDFKAGRSMLKENTGDILLVPIVVTTTDVQDFDFSIPIFKTWYELYAKYTVNRATSMSYLVTWSPEVWAAFLLTMFVIVICLWLVVKIRHIMPSADDVPVVQLQQQSATESPSLISYFFIVWGSICSQGTYIRHVLHTTSYSAVLFSRLTVDKSDLVIPSLDSLSRMRTHVLCVRRNSFGYLLFKANETDAFIMDRWLGVVNEPPCPQYEFGDIEVMAKSVCSDQTILVLETPMVMARAMSHQNGCRVMSVAGRHAVAYASVLTAKGSPYTPQINEMQVLLRFKLSIPSIKQIFIIIICT
ncbi:hypothetical protein ACI65C_009566 [Semiaphis heraclei]